jgi:tetratricopeptide (TPR) repeat protein
MTCEAGKLVVILHQGGAAWQIQDAEKITINGKSKFRLAPKGTAQVNQDSYKQMGQSLVGSAAMRMHRNGYMVVAGGGAWNPALPDGLAVKTAARLAEFWVAAGIQIQPDAKSKFVEYKFADVFAIIPGTSAPDTAVNFLANPANFAGVGEKTETDAFDERMALLVGIAGVVPGPASGKLKSMMLAEIDGALLRSSVGTSRYAEILQGLKYADVSDRAFPADGEQKKAREALRAKKAAVDQRIAILRALSGGAQWDAFISKYGDFEQYDGAFEDLRKLRERSHQESGAEHFAEGRKLSAEKNYTAALNELQLALKSDPGNKEAQGLFETVRIQNAEDKAGRDRTGVKPRDLVVQRQLSRQLAMADSDIGDGKLKDALSEIESAEALDKNAPETRLARAKLYRAQKDYPKAIAMLNSYDEMAKGDDAVVSGDVLRGRIQVELRNGKVSLKEGIAKAMDDGDFPQARTQARQGLQFDPEDVDFLYYGGVTAAILRDPADSQAMLKEYLAASEPYITQESKRRSEVLNIIPLIAGSAAGNKKGRPNWFTGAPCDEGLMYCPESLMPNVSPASVRASRKQTATFFWQQGVLTSVRTETLEQGTSQMTIYFDYYGPNQGVRRVSKEAFGEKDPPGPPRLTAGGTVGPGKGVYPALSTDKLVNPWMVEKLTGKRVGIVVAGNPWFHPFVWDGVYEFLAEYDAQGRVVSAQELQSKESRVLDFTWDGNRLMSVVERGRDGYRRDMKYNGSQIVGETIRAQGKTSKIEYKYQGGRLAEADCDADPSLDSRSRHVTFSY